jgi:ethanolamine transporter EutH
MTLLAGLAGGLAGVLWSGLVTTPWLAPGGDAAAAKGQGETAARLFVEAALRAAAGAALGFLFWLGWGLIAVVGWPWYATGLLFGGLCWVAIAAPVLATLLLHGRAQVRPVAAHAVEWLVACLSVGLLCALAWHRYA